MNTLLKIIRGVSRDARVTAAARTAVGLTAVAVVAALQTVLTSPEMESYSWVPIALAGLRILEGFFDHQDTEKPGV